MKNKEIRQVIDTALSGYAVSTEDEAKLLERALAGKCSKNGFPRKGVVAMATVLLFAALVTSAVGLPDLQIISKTTDDVLAYQVDVNNPMPGVFVAETPSDDAVATWGQEVADAIMELNAAVHLPEWKPERFSTLSNVHVRTEDFWGCTIDAEYTAEDGSLLDLSIHVFPEDGKYSMSVFVHHDNTENKTWIYNGIEYTHLRNYEHHTLNWMEGNCRVSISGFAEIDEFHKMVKSIYD